MAFLANEVADSNRRYDDERSNDDYNRKLVWERFLLIPGGEFPCLGRVTLQRGESGFALMNKW